MSMTLKYCPTCSDRLSFDVPRSEAERMYYWAKLRRHGSVTRQGVCDSCARETSVTSYLVQDWIPQEAV